MMSTSSRLLAALCTVQLAAAMLGNDRTQGRREPREVRKPAQIDCVMSPWSHWTTCDPCTNTKRRSRGVEAFVQFGGKPCLENHLADVAACTTGVECKMEPTPACPQDMFQCKSGMCVRMRLVCNGDFDCEDVTDETCVNPVRQPCGSRVLDNNEESRTAGYGINILGSDPRMNPFYNDYFGGMCKTVRNPKTQNLDRLPYNIATLNYMTHAVEKSSQETYEDKSSLLKELLVETKFTQSAGLSVKLIPSESTMGRSTSGAGGKSGGSGGSGGSGASGDSGGSGGPKFTPSVGAGFDLEAERKNMVKTITEYTATKKKTFMRVRGKLQLSTYRLLSNPQNLVVAAEFLDHVKMLPLVYEKGLYFTFLEDYGTHYTRTGKSGGEYEVVYILNQDTITEKKITMNEIHDCIKVGLSANIDSGIGIKKEAKTKLSPICEDFNSSVTANQESAALVDMVVSSIRGGSSEAAFAMKAYLNREGRMDVEKLQAWADTIPDNPALLWSEPEPIYNIIPLDMPGASARKNNLRLAIEQYEAEYNVCKCKPCHNGGTVALVDGACLCLCPHRYEGLACQITKTDKGEGRAHLPREAVTQEGNWSCWSAWSSCRGGTRSRTRSCNHGDVSGARCLGQTHNQGYCEV